MKLPQQRPPKRSPVLLTLIILLWSLLAGWGLAQATLPANSPAPDTQDHLPATVTVTELPTAPLIAQQIGAKPTIGTVDPVPPRYQLGQELYLQNCGTCHIALPPAVLPRETWKRLLEDTEHYGQQLQPLVDPTRLLVWQYLQVFSRPDQVDESIVYRVKRSRYFRALHPEVSLARDINVNSCVSCHPSAAQYDFRSLTPEWQEAS